MNDPNVCVVIAARNASATVATAVKSALAEARVREVVVVDDASTDDTATAARATDDGSGRLAIIQFDTNKGPSVARNAAIEASRADYISMLDADDFFLPGRFESMFECSDWDLIADNIVFIRNDRLNGFRNVPRFHSDTATLDLETFVRGNLVRGRGQRGELGFLKPVISRKFLERHRLRYDERLRLGEDYMLYASALAHGARFKIVRSCGYAAVVRQDSLSARHKTMDLRRFADADLELLSMRGISEPAKAALREHESETRNRYRLRHFLDAKSEHGLITALHEMRSRPATFWPVFSGVFRDKLASYRRALGLEYGTARVPETRYLLPGRSIGNDG